MSQIKNEIGNRYGRLTVIERAENEGCGKRVRIRWLCRCECGNLCIARGSSLRDGSKQSCGCLHDELFEKHRKRHIKHMMSGTRIFTEWNSIKARCGNPNNKSYKRYGGRGITICDEWSNDFLSFLKWAKESGYADDLTIERIDVNKGYSPDNCCWIPAANQAKNRRTTLRMKDKNGVERYVMDIAKEVGIPMNIVIARKAAGWDLEKAVYTPIIEQTLKKMVHQYTLGGTFVAEYMSIGEASKAVGVDRSSISRCCSGKLAKAGGYVWKYADIAE